MNQEKSALATLRERFQAEQKDWVERKFLRDPKNYAWHYTTRENLLALFEGGLVFTEDEAQLLLEYDTSLADLADEVAARERYDEVNDWLEYVMDEYMDELREDGINHD